MDGDRVVASGKSDHSQEWEVVLVRLHRAEGKVLALQLGMVEVFRNRKWKERCW